MKPRRKTLAVASGLVLALAAAVFVAWSASPYRQPEATAVAQRFLLMLQGGDFDGAFEMTTKSGYVGTTPAELRAIALRHTCWGGQVVSSFPPQTNGNRLRRWATGRPVDMHEVGIEFKGNCLLGVRLRRTPSNEWRVWYFASHAG